MKFPYQKLPARDSSQRGKPVPLIPIKLFDHRKVASFECYALVDSGADKSLFNAEVARELTIDLRNAPEEPFSGIEGGVLMAKMANIFIQVTGDDKVFDIPVGFIENLNLFGILGQEGFFDQFTVTFKRRKLELELKRSTR